MALKTFKAVFFNTQFGYNNTTYFFRDFFPPLIASHQNITPNLPIQNIDGLDYQVRNIQRVGNVIRGIFGRLRDDAPNVIDNNGTESQLPLQPTDRLVEKCHFMYFINTDILVWQISRDVGSANKFADYFSYLISTLRGDTTIFSIQPIVDQNAIQRALNGDVKSIEFKVARPRTPVRNQPVWNQQAFDIMNSVGGASIKMTISANRGILRGAQNYIRQLANNNAVSILKVKIDGENEPIDLFADRVDERFTVNLNGHYPLATDVFNALDAAYNNQRLLLTPYFNQGQIQQFP